MALFDTLKRGKTERAAAAAPIPELRVLVMSHSDPRLTRGGAEISAGALTGGLAAVPGVKTWFIGCASGNASVRLGANLTQPFGARDFLYQPAAPFDHFKFANRDPHYPRMLQELVEEIRPHVVHAHHYTVFGVETFRIIKRAAPACKIVVTLHEFLAICHNHGQMVKTKTNRLCNKASPLDCGRCFPQLGARDFFLRQRYIQIMLEAVDKFISPSNFLAERFVAWGLPADRVTVLENMPPVPHAGRRTVRAAPEPLSTGRDIHVGFFGQMSPLKGITVLIDAAAELQQDGTDNLVVDIYGDYSNQPAEFQLRVTEALEKAGSNVSYHGPYDNSEVLDLMRGVDAVVVPSIWWENSPVVIQEALLVGRPVICSDIGGMAEKVRPGLDGLHFAAGRARSLARVLQSIAKRPEMLDEISKTIRGPWSAADAVRAHLDVYAGLAAAADT